MTSACMVLIKRRIHEHDIGVQPRICTCIGDTHCDSGTRSQDYESNVPKRLQHAIFLISLCLPWPRALLVLPYDSDLRCFGTQTLVRESTIECLCMTKNVSANYPEPCMVPSGAIPTIDSNS